MSTANPFHFIGGLFLEFGAAAAAIVVLWPSHPAELPPAPAWSMTQPAPFTSQPVYFKRQADEQRDFAERPLLPPAPRSAFPQQAAYSQQPAYTQPNIESERYFSQSSRENVAYRQPQTEVARPRIRTFANEQYQPTHRSAERWEADYRSRY